MLSRTLDHSAMTAVEDAILDIERASSTLAMISDALGNGAHSHDDRAEAALDLVNAIIARSAGRLRTLCELDAKGAANE